MINTFIHRRDHLDTGSAGTIFNANVVDEIGVFPEENDIVDTIRGGDGVEYVYVKNFDMILFGEICQEDFQVEVGTMDYGMDIDGISCRKIIGK